MALGLPIKMVVLTIVGMAGLAAMLSAINNSAGTIPQAMHANVKSTNLIVLSTSSDIEIPVEVVNSRDGMPVYKASAVLSGLNATAINITDNDGKTILKFNKSDFDLKAGEGYLRLDVRSGGFQDYTNEYAVKIVK